MKKRIPIRIEPCEIQCDEDIAPYRILLGSILNQAVIDSLGLKYAKKRYEDMKMFPQNYTWMSRRTIKEQFMNSNGAHRFITGKGLLTFLKEWKMDIKPEFFKKTYLELEKDYLELPKKGVKNVIRKRILS